MTDREWLTLQEAAEALGVHPNTVRKMISDGRMEGRRLGARMIRVHADEVQRQLRAFRGVTLRRDARAGASELVRAAVSRLAYTVDALDGVHLNGTEKALLAEAVRSLVAVADLPP